MSDNELKSSLRLLFLPINIKLLHNRNQLIRRAARILEVREPGFGSQHQRGIRGVTPGKLLKKRTCDLVHYIVSLVENHNILSFSFFLYFFFVYFLLFSGGRSGGGGGVTATNRYQACASYCLMRNLFNFVGTGIICFKSVSRQCPDNIALVVALHCNNLWIMV